MMPVPESRKATEDTIAMMLRKGDEMNLGEPIGVMIMWPGEQVYMKAVWQRDANRKHTADSLLAASIDEMSKINGPL